jgi:murein L,D-transpeptidase YafK
MRFRYLVGPFLCLAGLAVLVSTADGPAGSAAPDLLPDAKRADLIRVEKAMRRLTLLREGRVLAVYHIALGFTPVGPKAIEGDGKTPEGRYRIAAKNPNSIAYLSLRISYPDPAQRAAAAAAGAPPGGDIMIHGLRNGFSWVGRLHRLIDWTDGCVGVTNAEVRSIYERVGIGTPIEIWG